MAASLGTLAKQSTDLQGGLQSRIDGATAAAKGWTNQITDQITDQIKGLVVRGLVVKEVGQGLVLGAVLLILAGAYLGLAKLMDPALAAGGLGLVLLLGVGLAAWLAGRRRR